MCADGLGPVLLEIAKSTNLQSLLPLKNGTGWQDDGAPACSWTGVNCDPMTSQITSINLSGLSITGLLSPLWGNISGLQSLDLSQNNFTGGFSVQCGMPACILFDNDRTAVSPAQN